MAGFQQYDTVNIWGFNSPEWVMGALAAGFAGGKVAGLYPTDTPDTAAYKAAPRQEARTLISQSRRP